MQLGIFTRIYASDSIEDVFAAMDESNLRCAQLNLSSAALPSLPDFYPEAAIEQICASSLAHKISIRALSGTFNMIDSDEATRRRGCDQFELQCRIAKAVGAPIVTLCTGSRNSDKWKWHKDNLSDHAWNDLLHSTETLLNHACKYDVTLGVEPEISNIVNTPARALRYLETFDTTHLGIIMDGANLMRPGQAQMQHEIMDEAFDLLGKHIILAHAKDFRDGASLSFTGPGLGTLDFEYYLEKLCSVGYAGSIIMHGMEENEIAKCSAYMQRKMKL